MEKNISVSEVVKTSWEYLKSQMWVLIGLFVGYCILVGILQGIGMSGGIMTALMSILIAVVQVIFMMGYYENVFQTMRGEEPQFSAYSEQMPKFLNAFLAALIVGFAIVIGTFLLILPGIYLAIRLMFTLPSIVDKNLSAMDAIKYSWNLTKGYEMPLFLLGLASIGIAIVGIILLGIGVFVAYPLIVIMMLYTYKKLSAIEEVAPEEIEEIVTPVVEEGTAQTIPEE